MGIQVQKTTVIQRHHYTSAVLISSRSLPSLRPSPGVLVRTPSAVVKDQSSNSFLSAVLNFLKATLLGDLLVFDGDRFTLRSNSGCLFIALLVRIRVLAERPPMLVLGRCSATSGTAAGRDRARLGVGPALDDTLLEREMSISSTSGSSPRFMGVS